jgi:hypothetical protein
VTASTLNRISRRSDPITGESDSGSGSDIDEEEDQAVIQFRPLADDDDDDNATLGETDTELSGNIGDLSEMIKKIVWNFEPVEEGDILRPVKQLYSGPCGIRRSVAASFQTPTEALEICGGLSRDFVRRLVVNSNNYFHQFIRPNIGKNNHHSGMKWTNISLKEMYHFLGILLKISIMERDAGGYPSYFAKENKRLYTGTLSSSYMTVVSDSAGWAWKFR